MAKLPNIDFEAMDLLKRAEANPDAAAQVLLLAARYMREGQVVPENITAHLAGAFEAAMQKPQSQRGKALLLELHITATNQRPADVDWYALGQRFDELVNMGESQNAAASQIAVEFGISESTAKRIWSTKFKPAMAANRAALED
jgi:hypothetical protein